MNIRDLFGGGVSNAESVGPVTRCQVDLSIPALVPKDVIDSLGELVKLIFAKNGKKRILVGPLILRALTGLPRRHSNQSWCSQVLTRHRLSKRRANTALNVCVSEYLSCFIP